MWLGNLLQRALDNLGQRVIMRLFGIFLLFQMKMFVGTGWSKETVDCNFFLTDPKFMKRAITQWFLESLYREVLVFGYFKSVRCMEFCLSESFQYRAFPAPYMAYTPLDASKPQTYILFIYMLSDTSSRYLRTNQDNSRHHQTPTDTKRHQQTSPDTRKCRLRMCGGSYWHGMAFSGVWWCL